MIASTGTARIRVALPLRTWKDTARMAASRIWRHTLTPGALAATLLAGIAATPLPAAARDNDRRGASSLPRESAIRDRDGFTAGRNQNYRDGRTVQRDERGFRSGGVRRDGTVTDRNGFRTGRVVQR